MSKLVILFKSGLRAMCGNYRGIAINDTLSKIYDSILNKRLQEWLSIDKAQAGAQKGRSCIEHILTLRMIIDYCKCKKKKMFIVFVDFKKAYDSVPRNKIMECLKKRGCGRTMLSAIMAAYKAQNMYYEVL